MSWSRSQRCSAPVVQLTPVSQNFSGRIWRHYVINRLHPEFRTTRISVCLYCTWRILRTRFRNMVSIMFTRSVTTRISPTVVVRLENCIKEVSHRMSANHLKLNTDKTELLMAGWVHGPVMLGNAGLALRLGSETIQASEMSHCYCYSSWSDTFFWRISRVI